MAPGPGVGCEWPTAGDTSSRDSPLWPLLLDTSHCGLGLLTMATNSGETSVWPPRDPPATCHHLQGHLIVATTLGSPHCSHQPQGHVTVGTIIMSTSSGDTLTQMLYPGTSHQVLQIQGCVTPRPRTISSDHVPSCPRPHLTYPESP